VTLGADVGRLGAGLTRAARRSARDLQRPIETRRTIPATRAAHTRTARAVLAGACPAIGDASAVAPTIEQAWIEGERTGSHDQCNPSSSEANHDRDIRSDSLERQLYGPHFVGYNVGMSGGAVGSLPAPGERLGAYEVIAELACGGMAAVYLARRRFEVGGLGKLVAVKVVLPHLRDREFVTMFLDEVRVAVAIAHTNVVQVLDVGECDGWPYMVMEYLRGQSLDRVVRRARDQRIVADGPILMALAQAAAGLHAAHETVGDDGEPLGIVHRDVTPRNIHVGYDGCTKIVDFGIAASRGKIVKTQPGVVKGTLHYMPPEMISRAHRVDRRADVWSFGVVRGRP
jgi:serine/threonine protein kinase